MEAKLTVRRVVKRAAGRHRYAGACRPDEVVLKEVWSSVVAATEQLEQVVGGVEMQKP